MQDNKQTEMIRRAFKALVKDLRTSTPGHVVAFNPETQLAQVQIGIVTTLADGSTIEPGPLFEVPVMFTGGGGFVIEHELNPGDEGLIVFSQRCIDAWVETGGVAENPIMRFHDVNDAMFIPGIRSQPNKIGGFVNDGVRLRNADATGYAWLKKDGTFELKATSLKIMNDVSIDGKLDASGDVTGAGISLSTHTHKYVDTQPNGTPATKPTEGPE